VRGHAEESPEVKAARALREAARRFAGFYLIHGFGGPDVEESDRALAAAAVAYAETLSRSRTRAKRTKGPAR
jgi:hypothetical protein